jgi:hypothetical protein
MIEEEAVAAIDAAMKHKEKTFRLILHLRSAPISLPEKLDPIRLSEISRVLLVRAIGSPCSLAWLHPRRPYADTSLAKNTGHIMCFYEKVKKVKADVAAVLVCSQFRKRC